VLALCGSCAGIANVMGIGSSVSPSNSGNMAKQISGGTATLAATATPAVPPTPTHVLTWTTIQRFTGTSAEKTPVFTVPAEWRIVWTCKATDSFGGGNFIVTVTGADGTPLDLAVNTQGNDSATTYEHQAAGQVYLDINTFDEQWTITVQARQ